MRGASLRRVGRRDGRDGGIRWGIDVRRRRWFAQAAVSLGVVGALIALGGCRREPAAERTPAPHAGDALHEWGLFGGVANPQALEIATSPHSAGRTRDEARRHCASGVAGRWTFSEAEPPQASEAGMRLRFHDEPTPRGR
jgi:hypothetical protein